MRQDREVFEVKTLELTDTTSSNLYRNELPHPHRVLNVERFPAYEPRADDNCRNSRHSF